MASCAPRPLHNSSFANVSFSEIYKGPHEREPSEAPSVSTETEEKKNDREPENMSRWDGERKMSTTRTSLAIRKRDKSLRRRFGALHTVPEQNVRVKYKFLSTVGRTF